MAQRIVVQLAAEAEGDLAAIYAHRLKQRGADGPDGAEALLDVLYDALATLADFPLRGPVVPELEPLGIHAYRQLSLPPLRVVYLPEEAVVTVMLIADSRRDFRKLLEDRLLRVG